MNVKSSEISVDTKGLRNNTIPQASRTNSNIAKARKCFNNISMPKNFTKKTELTGIINRLAQIEKDVDGIIKYINQKTNDFEAAEKKAQAMAAGLNWSPSYQGGGISNGVNNGYGVLILNPGEVLEQFKRTGATIFNAISAFSEGATEMFFDGGEKAFELLGAIVKTPYYYIKDAITNSINGNDKKSDNLMQSWMKTMEFITEKGQAELNHLIEHESNESQNINNLSYAPFRYEGMGYSGAKMLGGIFGAAYGPSMATGATSTAMGANSILSSTLSTGATAGARGTSEYWQIKKANSNGDDWKTKENLVGGLKYGTITAIWETAQFLIGAEALGKIGTPVARVGVNTVLNALDPIVRAAVMSDLDDTSFAQNFIDQGGMNAVIMAGTIGFAGSAIGELANYRANKNNYEANNTKNTDNLEAKDTEIKSMIDDIIHPKDNIVANSWLHNLFSKEDEIDDVIKHLKGFEGLDEDGLKILREQIRADLDNGVLRLESFSELDEDTFIQLFNARHPNSIDINGNRSLQNGTQVAEYFKDAKAYVGSLVIFEDEYGNPLRYASGEVVNLTSMMSGIPTEDILSCYHYLNDEQKNVFISLLANAKNYSDSDTDTLRAYSHLLGPVLTAESRQSDVNFSGAIFKGETGEILDPSGQVIKFDDYMKRGYYDSIGSVPYDYSVRTMMRNMDNIVENPAPLRENLIVRRNIDGLFSDGDMLLNPKVGDIFNDKALTATGACPIKSFDNRKIHLEIEVPAGTSVAYIEPAVAGRYKYDNAQWGIPYYDTENNRWLDSIFYDRKKNQWVELNNSSKVGWKGSVYGQQEVVLGRNNSYEIVDITPKLGTNELVIRARMVQTNPSIIKEIGVGRVPERDTYTNYFQRYGGNVKTQQVDLYDAAYNLKNKGLLASYEAEVRDMRNSGLYKDTIPEHGIDHAEKVLFNAMLIGDDAGFSDREMKLLTEAAKWHDSGRTLIGPEHGISGAQQAGSYLMNGTKYSDNMIVQAAIEYHAVNDDVETWNSIMKKYNISESDRESATKVAIALKDADALDRTRFPGNLNPQYLRTNSAQKFVKTSYQVQELRGTNELKKIRNPQNIIPMLQKKGFSNYEIAFWINNRNYPTQVWRNINYRINNALGGK